MLWITVALREKYSVLLQSVYNNYLIHTFSKILKHCDSSTFLLPFLITPRVFLPSAWASGIHSNTYHHQAPAILNLNLKGHSFTIVW